MMNAITTPMVRCDSSEEDEKDWETLSSSIEKAYTRKLRIVRCGQKVQLRITRSKKKKNYRKKI
jgi:hypothetical protein